MIDPNKTIEEQKSDLSKALTDLGSRFANLTTRVTELENIKDALQSAANDNRKLHYQEAGQWARHYSTVRMTIGTFSVTACATIIGLKWNELASNEYVWNGPICLWLLSALIFMAFTYQTFDRLNSQMKYRELLPTKPGDVHNKRAWMILDAGAIAIAGLTILFAWLAHTRGSCEIYDFLKMALWLVGLGWIVFALVVQLIWWKRS